MISPIAAWILHVDNSQILLMSKSSCVQQPLLRANVLIILNILISWDSIFQMVYFMKVILKIKMAYHLKNAMHYLSGKVWIIKAICLRRNFTLFLMMRYWSRLLNMQVLHLLNIGLLSMEKYSRHVFNH